MKKDGYNEYASRSWILIPKINGRFIDSIIIYGAILYLGINIYYKGGIKNAIEMINSGYGKELFLLNHRNY